MSVVCWKFLKFPFLIALHLFVRNKLSSLRKSIEMESDSKPRPVVHGHTRLFYGCD